MAEKEVIPQKAVRLSTDAYVEDSELISQIMADLKLDSRKEAIHALCKRYKEEDSESGEPENSRCDFLVKDGAGLFCAKNCAKPKKSTVEKCRVCLKAQRIAKRQEELKAIAELGERHRSDIAFNMEYRFFKRLTVDVDSYHDIPSRITLAEKFLDKQDVEMQELKKPIEEKLAEITTLKAQNATLETDNAFMRQQLDELKKDPLAEKCAWQSIELNNKNEEIKKLKAENAKQEQTINDYMFGRKPT